MRAALLVTVPTAACLLAAAVDAAAQSRPASAGDSAAAPRATPGPTPAAVPDATAEAPPPVLAGFKVSGYAEASYAWSSKPVGTGIAGRLYDRFHNQFTLNALKVVLDRPYAADRLDAGVHADVILGQNASVIQSSGLKLGEQGDLTQLYVTLNVPTRNGNGVQLKVGKIATLLGLEVIEDPANPNWSIGNLFSFVENFTAVGASVEHRFNRLADVQLRLVDGWDVAADNNSGLSFMGRLGLAPDTLTSLALVGYAGPEAADSHAKRYGGEVLLTRRLASRVSASVQADYGREDGLVLGAGDATTAASWWGAGAWLTFDLAPTLALALRGDVVDDRDGVRSNGFLFPSFADAPGTRHRFGSGTVTLNVKSWANVLVRPEVRYDRSSLPVYDARRGQLTAGLGVAYLF
jgi:hypothetical protein